jgi:tRNA threonylcarbamoyl adenosine modification protein YeaZ
MNLNLAVGFGGDRLVQSSDRMQKSHGQMIIKKIDELVQSAGLAKTDLQGIVVCLGPGSFTGLRIGLAAAKGMATALGCPLVGVSMFDLAAYKLEDHTAPVVLLLPHRRDEFFVADIINGICDAKSIEAVGIAELPARVADREIRVIGFDPAALASGGGNGSPVKVLEYNAGDLLHVGASRLNAGEFDDSADLEPLYLQKSQAEIKFEQRRKDN